MRWIFLKIKKLERDVKIDFLHSFLVFVVIFIIFNIWVNHSFEGNYWGPFAPGEHFGIPSRESDMGIYPNNEVGWDGQFYYYESNDIFATKDEYLHIDTPAYRYQRIGMPLIARGVSLILGKQMTSPALYHFLQIFIVAIGFFVLIRWLRKNNIKQIYAYAWLLSAGVINALAYGLPDPVGDAFFIISIVSALSGELMLYSIATIFLLLVREGYSLYAALIFFFTVFNKIPWKNKDNKKRIIFTMLPGVIVVAWMGYVTYRFGITPISATKNANLTSAPFVGAMKSFIDSIRQGNVIEVLFKEFAVFILLFSMYKVIKLRKVSYISYAVLGYAILMASLGTTVWVEYSGYMKALGSIIAVLIIYMAYDNKKILISILSIIIITQGVIYNYHIKKDAMYTKFEKSNIAQNVDVQKNDKLNEFKSNISSESKVIVIDNSKNLFRNFLRKIYNIDVSVTNMSKDDWYLAPEYGKNSICLSYNIYDKNGENKLYDGIRTRIGTNILSDESKNIEMKFTPPSKPGQYILRISMVQEEVAWFYMQPNGGYLDIQLEVK